MQGRQIPREMQSRGEAWVDGTLCLGYSDDHWVSCACLRTAALRKEGNGSRWEWDELEAHRNHASVSSWRTRARTSPERQTLCLSEMQRLQPYSIPTLQASCSHAVVTLKWMSEDGNHRSTPSPCEDLWSSTAGRDLRLCIGSASCGCTTAAPRSLMRCQRIRNPCLLVQQNLLCPQTRSCSYCYLYERQQHEVFCR